MSADQVLASLESPFVTGQDLVNHGQHAHGELTRMNVSLVLRISVTQQEHSVPATFYCGLLIDLTSSAVAW